MSQPWEDFDQGATTASAPSPDEGPWNDFSDKLTVEPNPYEKAKLKYPETRGVFDNSDDLLRAVVNDPKSIPKIAAGLGMSPFDLAGKIANAAAQDAGAVIGANPEGFGNVEQVLSQTPVDTTPLPSEKTLADISKEHPIIATTGKVASGLAQTAPMMAAGLPGGALGRLISLGFSADMIAGGNEAAKQLGEEMGKNPEDRDADKVTSAVSSLIQSGAFAPLAGAHGLKPGVTGELALQLLKDPKVYPMEKPSAPVVETVSQNPWDDFKQPETPAAANVPKSAEEVPTTFAPSETKTPDPNWRVTVQPDEVDNGKLIPSGYVQIDDVTGGQNVWSKSPATLAKEGIDVPDFSKLPKGQYTFAEAEQLLKQQQSSPPPEQEPITASPAPQAEPAAQPEAPAVEEPLNHGDEVHATMPDGKEVKGHIVGADDAGNAVLLQQNGKSVTLPEKLTEVQNANPEQKPVEVLRNPSPGPIEEVAGGSPGDVQQIAEPRPGEEAGLPQAEQDLADITAAQQRRQANKSAAVQSALEKVSPPSSGNQKMADRFRKLAEGMYKTIEDKRRPMTQNMTPKRSREYYSRLFDADNLERDQKGMLALADAHEKGTLPTILSDVKTKDDVHKLLYKGLKGGGYYDVIPDPEYANKSPKAVALQRLLEAKTETPAEKAIREERERAQHIKALEEKMRFSNMPGFFPTPKPLADEMVSRLGVQPGQSILEPSAGIGHLADAVKAVEPTAKITTVERLNTPREVLAAKGYEVAGDDFMQHRGQYDRIIMNPPFEKGQDIDHVRHAYDQLKPGGKIVALMSEGAFGRSDKKATDFRKWLDEVGGTSEKSSEGAFKGVQAFRQTGTATRIVEIEKPELKTKPAETPVQATAKVAEHIAEVKATEGTRPAKEIKTELVDRLEKAIQDAPNAADVGAIFSKSKKTWSDPVYGRFPANVEFKKTIDIPGDGKFTIFNTKEHLGWVLERAKALKTSAGEPVKVSYSGTSKSDRDWVQKQLESQQNPTEAEPKRIGMGAAIPEEFEKNQNSPTATKNATIERERAARGLPPAIEPARRSFGEVWDRAMAMIDRDPAVQDALIDELRKNPRAVTDLENALLLHRQIELQNDYGKLTQDMAQAYDDAKEFPNRMADVEELKPRVANVTDRLFDLYEINKKVGTETGRGLNARKMMAYEDYTLAKMELDARAANGGRPLTETESAQVTALHDKIEKLRKEFDTYTAQAQARISSLESEKALNDIRAKPEPPIEPHIRTLAEKIISNLENQGNAARERIKARRGRLMTGFDPVDLADHAIVGAELLAKAGFKTAEWTAAMIKEFGDYVKPHLDQILKAAEKKINEQMAPQNAPKVKRALKEKVQASPKDTLLAKLRKRIEDGKKDEITGYVQKLARLYVGEGITDRDELIDAIHQNLKDIDPTITRRETMDAISGYGDFKQLTKDQISKELRDLKGQMQQVSKLEDMQAGQPPLKTGIERRIPSREESRLIKLVNEAKRKFQIPITDPNTQLKSALDTLKTRMQNRIEELQQKIADNDFEPRARPEPLKLDAEALRIKANYERAKLEFERALQDYRLKNRNWLEKASDTLVKWRRGFLLSSPITLAKLTSAAIQRLSITPAEEAIGGAISAVIPRVAEKAQREGGFNTKAEAKAITEVFTTGMKDAWETLRTGTSPLDVLYGQGREGYVRESMSLPRSVIDFFGNIHAALKAPVKRAEFARAFEKRVAAAIHDRIDVSDPMVQTRIAVDSYKDANRSIFLQDNRLVTAYKMFLAGLEQKNKETGKPTISGKLGATAGRLALPIVRVPTNIVAETFTYAFGSMTGGARLANAFAKGFENLKPNEADLIMRELKKGSLGAVALLLGYFNANNFGGYYQPGQKREKGDVKFGNVKLFGHEIPSFLVHNPLLEVLQLGATIRRVEESKMKGEAQGLPTGIMAGALGLADEVPFVREMFGEIPKMFNPREQGSFIGELAKSVFIPQLLQWLANQSDKDQSGNTKPRSPQTAWQHIETGIPGLRKNVPEKKSNQLPQ